MICASPAVHTAAVSVFYLDSMRRRRYSSPGECPLYSFFPTPNKKQSNEASLRAVTTTLLYKG